MILHETKFQNWRALAISKTNQEHLIVLGLSLEQVKKNYPLSFSEVLLPEEQVDISKIFLQKWKGMPDRGEWLSQESLQVPQLSKEAEYIKA